jgi:tetratricopeptide (TPR) repeat protein
MPRLRAALAPLLLAALAACAHPHSGATPVAVGLEHQSAAGDAYARGRTALASGEVGVAVEQFRRALRADPASVPALNGLAVAYDEIGRFDVAQGLYRRALAIAPQSAATMNNLGRSLLRQGAAAAALPYLVAAREQAGPAQLAVVEANLADARRIAAAPAARGGAASPDVALERVGAREHLLRTGPSPRRLIPGGEVSARAARAPPAVERSRSLKPPLIEISNGTGCNRMAARTASFLRSQGIAVARLTNADSFGYRTTLVLFRPGHEQEAFRVAALLPAPVQPAPAEAQSADVRVVLGHDLAGFDRQLQAQEAGADVP